MPVYLGHVEEGDLYSIQPSRQLYIARVGAGDLYIEPDIEPEVSQPDIEPEVSQPDIGPEVSQPDIGPEVSQPNTSAPIVEQALPASPAVIPPSGISILNKTVFLSVYLDETFNGGAYSSGLSEAFQYIAKIFQKYRLPNPAVVNGSIMQFDATEKNLVSNLGKASIEINNDSSLKFYVVMYFSISPDSLNTLTDLISGAIEQLLDIKTNLPLPMVDELKAMQPEEPEVPPTKPPFVDDSDYGGGYIGDSDYEVTPAPTEICTKEAGFIVIDWTGERLEYTDGCQKKLIIDMLNNDNISYHYEGYEEVSNPEIVAPPAPEPPLETNPPILRARSPQENPVAVEEIALVEPQISRRRSPQTNPLIVEEIAFVEPTISRRRSLAS